MSTPPPPDRPPPGQPGMAGREAARLRGSPNAGATPRMETVLLGAAELARRAAMAKSRHRLRIAAAGFGVLFGGVAAKLAYVTVLAPLAPSAAEIAPPVPADAGRIPLPEADDQGPSVALMHHPRATITDRRGQILAISVPTAALYANPQEMTDPAEAARKLKSVLPGLDAAEALRRLAAAKKQFVYLERQITPTEEVAINNLGIPGVYFEAGEKRRYPQGDAAAQVLGGVDADRDGAAGVEREFDRRLKTDPSPLHLSLDIRVQAVMRDELEKSKDEFQAIGACGIVMDVRSGEVIAMVSLPDYDANDFTTAKNEQKFNRAISGRYEPGSTFKLQTAAMALDDGTAHIWDQFDAAHAIHIGRFTITDFQGKHRFLYLPEVLAYSSNLGAAHIALGVGGERQRDWLARMGMFKRIGIELPETFPPNFQPADRWGESTIMTVGFGHGIAVSPLHVVRGTAALANGGYVLNPTILARAPDAPDAPPPGLAPMMAISTSDTVRKLMRLVVTDGYGKPADVDGYFVGGKTGTAEKVGNHAYRKHANISAFMSVFPMNAPRYAVYFMLDEPHGNKETGGFSTAGAVSAPGAGRVIARIAPMLGLFPQTADEPAIQASLAIPMQPARGSGEPTGQHPAPPFEPNLLALRHEASFSAPLSR